MQAENIKTVVVVGGGTMGQGIAQNFAEAGLSVRIVDVDKEQLHRSLSQVNANLKLFQEFGLLKEDISSIESRIQPFLTEDLNSAVSGCDFVVEAIPEVLELKRQLFAGLDSCSDHVILASNTSSFTVSLIAEGCRTTDRIVGLHYFNPAHIMPAVEIHSGPRTGAAVIETTRALMIKVGKKPIMVRKEMPGFIINRLQAAIGREISYLIDLGVATPEDMDAAATACYGLRWSCIGFMEAMDMIGLDVATAASGQIYKDLCNGIEPSPTMVEKVRKGELGVKSGRGWYDYTGKTRAEVLDNQNRRLLKQLALFRENELSGEN